jgi:hypothetical protein
MKQNAEKEIKYFVALNNYRNLLEQFTGIFAFQAIIHSEFIHEGGIGLYSNCRALKEQNSMPLLWAG